jgi:hypothetical protein
MKIYASRRSLIKKFASIFCFVFGGPFFGANAQQAGGHHPVAEGLYGKILQRCDSVEKHFDRQGYVHAQRFRPRKIFSRDVDDE